MTKVGSITVDIIKADITQLAVDAIVNAANNTLAMGGGVAGAIKKAGGKAIEDEAVKKGPIAIGGAVYTSGGSLPARYVIHAATMGLDFKTDEIKIRSACKSALQVAAELGVASIAFPAMGCGTGGFPFLASAKIMAQEVLRFAREEKSKLQKIVLCLYNDQAYGIFEKTVTSYLDYVQHKLQQGPFSTVDIIIEVKGGIVIIKRSNPPFGWALPGGFVDYNESLETAALREAQEETGLEVKELKQFHTYSTPGRDPRFHTIATVFFGKAAGIPKAADDAEDAKVIPLDSIDSLDFAFDHKQILLDYRASLKR